MGTVHEHSAFLSVQQVEFYLYSPFVKFVFWELPPFFSAMPGWRVTFHKNRFACVIIHFSRVMTGMIFVMLIFMKNSASSGDISRVVAHLEEQGFKPEVITSGDSRMIQVATDGRDIPSLEAFDGVNRIVHTEPRFRLASREFKKMDTVVEVGDRKIGGGNFCVIAGPCAVESIEIAHEIAMVLARENLKLMRGGAFKPRTSPYSFQGLGYNGLELLAEIRKKTGVLIVTEAIDVESVDRVEKVAEMIQVGSRNMQNFSLLKRLGKISKPILLKRGMSSTIEELLLAAEYILSGGNNNVVLCERGIRTFDSFTRNTLDLSAVPALKELSHLPVIVDPSHATGRRSFIQPMSRAAMACGADGILIEIHPHPEHAFSDGGQTLDLTEFKSLMGELHELAKIMKLKVN